MRKLIPFVLLLLAACPPNPNPPPQPDADAAGPGAPDAGPTPVVDAMPAPDAAPLDACGVGEQNLLKLGCKDSRDRLIGGPNLHGVPWSRLCRENAAHGVDMRPICIATARSCGEVMSCN